MAAQLLKNVSVRTSSVSFLMPIGNADKLGKALMSDYDNFNINWDDDDNQDTTEATWETTEEKEEPATEADFSIATGGDEWNLNLPADEDQVTATGQDPALLDALHAPEPAFSGEGEIVQITHVGANGEEFSRDVHLSADPLSENEARELSARIRSTTSALYLLIKRAHVGKAWKALGYGSFQEYVKVEFDYSRSYAYKLLNQANVIEAIEQAAPEGTKIHVSELSARSLKQDLPDIIDEIEERTEGLDSNEASDVIADILQDAKERRQEDRDLDVEDFDTFDGDAPMPQSNNFEYIDAEENEEEFDTFLQDDDVHTSMEHLEDLWLLLNRLDELGRLFQKNNLNELFKLLPTHKREAFTAQVESHQVSVERLKTEWDEFILENPVSNDVPLEEEDEGYSYE